VLIAHCPAPPRTDSKVAAPVARAVAPSMMVEESAQAMVSVASSTGMLIAAAAGDFGGYTIPVIGLAVLAAIVALLAGPVED